MGTKKTEKPFEWIDLSDLDQCQWAAQYLRKEAVRGSILLRKNEPISSGGLESLIAKLQSNHDQPPRDVVLEDLDRRMRRAWDEIVRRKDPTTKAYQFRMSKSMAGKLGWLRSTWKQPISTIVEALITEAYEIGKTEAYKIEALKKRDTHIKKTSKRLLQLESKLKKSQEREKALEKLAEDLTGMVCRAEHKLEQGLQPDARLDPEAAQLVDKKAHAAYEVYVKGIEADMRRVQLPDKLSTESQRDIQALELAMQNFYPHHGNTPRLKSAPNKPDLV